MPRAPRHEAAISKSEALLKETAETIQCPPFFRDAAHVINSLRKWRPKETPLALHFVAIAVKELLERHNEGAKMSLLMAQGLAEEKLRNTLMQLFCAAFHRNGRCEEQSEKMALNFAQAMSQNFEAIMEMIQQGGGTISLGPGCSAQVVPVGLPTVKQPVNKPKSKKNLPPANPWN